MGGYYPSFKEIKLYGSKTSQYNKLHNVKITPKTKNPDDIILCDNVFTVYVNIDEFREI